MWAPNTCWDDNLVVSIPSDFLFPRPKNYWSKFVAEVCSFQKYDVDEDSWYSLEMLFYSVP